MNKNILTFDEWAILGKDAGMEKGHHASVSHMLKIIFYEYEKKKKKYSAIDFGCGNGWVVRKLKDHSLCSLVHGIDGSKEMIKKAQAYDMEGLYFNENIELWKNEYTYDVIFSMETLYYFKNPEIIIKNIYNNVFNQNGMIVIGVDHYAENTESLNWGAQFNLDITTLSIDDWCSAFKNVGFEDVQYKQVEPTNNWQGTLIITGRKK